MLAFEAKPIPLITWGSMAPPFQDHVYFHHREHFPFQPNIVPFSPVNAWWMSEAALLAYTSETFAFPRFISAGLDNVRFFTGHSTQCYVAANNYFAIVAFRGTEFTIDQGPDALGQFISDLSVDIDIRWVDAPGGGKIHRGFNEALSEIWSKLLPHLEKLAQKGIKIWVTGHSLGGALAVLTATRFRKIHGLYTFGAPRLGNRNFVSSFPMRSFRIINKNDMVPHLPFYPYADLGSLAYIDSNGTLHHSINAWQRLKDEIRGHLNSIVESVRNLNQGWTATLAEGLKDHTPLLYALHLWNHLIHTHTGNRV